MKTYSFNIFGWVVIITKRGKFCNVREKNEQLLNDWNHKTTTW